MADIESRIHDLTTGRPSDQIEVGYEGHLHCVGGVEQVVPALEVAWIPDIPGGYHRLVHARPGMH